ncbi:MAG: radical SAM family heme chaperone HemW [Alistipes sp.]|nr:radical SAM family heme chaperone HemW [Alistipes sp.]
MATLYFHVPFCRKICTYCDFYKVGAVELLPRVVEGMHRELRERVGELHSRSLTSIYFGGGTPSLLAPEDIESLINAARELFDCSAVTEITLEANPDDLTTEYVDNLRRTSVNRLSLGIQSFDDRVLRFMNRRHTAKEAEDAVRRLRDAGYDNISVDVIFGIAGFGDTLTDTLRRVVALDVEHISAYHLTVEERTRLGLLMQRGEYVPISDEVSESEYLAVHETLQAAGYEHYEISNYAKSGRRAQHNSAYWMGVEYLGIGPGAHSFTGEERRWCTSTAKQYADGDMRFDSESLTERDHLNEYVMTSLRRVEGIDLEYVEQRFGLSERHRLQHAAKEWIAGGIVDVRGGALAIRAEHFLVSDAVIESLFA